MAAACRFFVCRRLSVSGPERVNICTVGIRIIVTKKGTLKFESDFLGSRWRFKMPARLGGIWLGAEVVGFDGDYTRPPTQARWYQQSTGVTALINIS